MRCGRFRPISTVLNAIRSGRLGSESKITRRPLLQQNKRTPRSPYTPAAYPPSRRARLAPCAALKPERWAKSGRAAQFRSAGKTALLRDNPVSRAQTGPERAWA